MREARSTSGLGVSPLGAYIAFAVITSTLYGVAAYLPPFLPLEIRPSVVDHAVPFVPATAWVYVTYFLLAPAFLVLAQRTALWREVFLVVALCVLGNITINFLLPTRVVGTPVAPPGTLLALVQRYDTTLCALPSGHVSLPVVLSVGSLVAAVGATGTGDARRWRALASLFAAWSVALAISALTTKQHHLVDVLGGVAWGVATGCVYAAARRARGAKPLLHTPTIYALCVEWCVIGITLWVALRWWHPAVIAAAVIVIATRQHALFILYHDGVHQLISSSRRLNDLVTNLFVGVPQLFPVNLYRALHLVHHRTVGADHDPERALLFRGQPWDYRPLGAVPLVRQLAGDLFLWNALAMLLRYARERRNPARSRWLPQTRSYPELWFLFAMFAAAGTALAAVNPTLTLRLALLWFVPLFTLMQLLQKVRSFAEHAGDGEGEALSYSWAPGLMGRLTIWPYNINYHREHHARPGVPWDELPSTFPDVLQRPGCELGAHLFNGRVW